MTDFELEDTEGRRRRLSDFHGRPVVLVVVGGPSRDAAIQAGIQLAPSLYESDADLIAVADMPSVPRMMRGVVRGAIRAGLRRAMSEATRHAPDAPADAWDRFTLLLDWDAVGLDALGLHGQTDRFHVLVLDRSGEPRGRLAQGDVGEDELIDWILRLVEAM
jgi:hypothetical protein